MGILLTIQAFSAERGIPPEPQFRAMTIDADIAIGYGIAVADVDGDGLPDIVLCDKNQIVWYQNPYWNKYVIAENLTPLDHVCVAAMDITGDGKAEIAVGAGWNPGDTTGSGALFYLEPPADRRGLWNPVALPHDPTIHRIRWARDPAGKPSLVSVPLHGRGNHPGRGEGVGVRVQRYQWPQASSSSGSDWPTEILNSDYHKTHNLDVVTWQDQKGQDILLAAKEGAFLIEWQSSDARYRTRQIGSDANGGVGEIRAGQLGGNQRFVAGISPMHGNEVVVFVPPVDGDENMDDLWDRRVLDDTLIDGHALACGDLLGLGRDQVVAGWRAMNRPGVAVGIKLYTPMDAEGKSWRTTLVDNNVMACEDLVLADLNGDGRLDIVAAGRATKNVRIYYNETPQ
jgi:hypothetical protein